MALEDAYAFPVLLPIPELYGHVIRTGHDEGLCGVDHDTSDVT